MICLAILGAKISQPYIAIRTKYNYAVLSSHCIVTSTLNCIGYNEEFLECFD